MSMVKISLSSPEELKSRKISSACVLSLMYDGKDFTIGAIILSKTEARNEFSRETRGRKDRTTWVVRFADLGQEVNARSSRSDDDEIY